MKKYARATFLFVVGAFVFGNAAAQTTTQKVSAADKYVISAKAGGVNLTQGSVSTERIDGSSGRLIKGDEIEIGDRVITGADGKAEILLNPGSFIRLGGNSSFKFTSTSLDDLRIEFERGSAIFEVFATEKFRVNIATQKEKIALFETGVYRIDVKADGSGSISVTDGKAALGRISNLTLVTSGKVATFGAGDVTVAKFDSGKRDELAEWSKTRAKDVAKLNASLQNAAFKNTLLSSFNRGSFNMYSSFGLWVLDPFSNSFCFMPFGRGWNSPYRYGYHYGGGDVLPIRLPVYVPQSKDADWRHNRIPPTDPPYIAVERQQKATEWRRQGGGDSGSLFPSDDSKRNGGGSSDRGYSGDSGGRILNTPTSTAASTPAPVQMPPPQPITPAGPIDH